MQITYNNVMITTIHHISHIQGHGTPLLNLCPTQEYRAEEVDGGWNPASIPFVKLPSKRKGYGFKIHVRTHIGSYVGTIVFSLSQACTSCTLLSACHKCRNWGWPGTTWSVHRVRLKPCSRGCTGPAPFLWAGRPQLHQIRLPGTRHHVFPGCA